jgi:hypothetical protein
MKTPHLESLLSNLEQCADIFDRLYNRDELKYCSTQRLVLDLGIHFEPKIDSPFPGKRKECYKNCFHVILSDLTNDSNLYYCEGFAAYEGTIPIATHAWLINDRGEVIDPTWRDSQSFINPVYFGVVFNWKFVKAVASKTKVYGILDNDRAIEYEFKRLGLPSDALHPQFHNISQPSLVNTL